MESKNLLTLAITLTVGIILAGSLLMPVISDATETERTFTNEGLFYIDASGEDVTIAYDNSALNSIEINGETLTIPTTNDATVLYTEDSIFRYVTTGGGQLQTRGSIAANTVKTCEITYSNGSYSGTLTNTSDTTVSVSGSYTELVHVADKADRIMTKPVAQYVLGDSQIEAFGVVYASNFTNDKNSLVHIEGTVKDGVTIEVLKTTDGTALSTITVSDISINAQKVDGYADLYKLTSITFVMTEGAATYNATFNIYTIPAEVNAELSQHLAPGEIAILNALPVLIIVALVMMAAGALYLKRDD